ncbi:hypothetical protein AVEN_48544-1 [Araneus ventricosus]|uniref:Uncharacterized protein n=1 Tax=Araneus ventricosus TaxID=182803 RepID=A0A4Y2NYL8_ARAVE|nr:hypothetical protein AVEN_48544-1 [Araneus ventricosus]
MDNSGRYSLHQLVESDDNLEELCEFFAGGGDPNHNVVGDNTLLHIAAQSYKWNEKVVQKLINAGADTDLSTNVGHTPLQFAVMSRNCGAVQALIKAGSVSKTPSGERPCTMLLRLVILGLHIFIGCMLSAVLLMCGS